MQKDGQVILRAVNQLLLALQSGGKRIYTGTQFTLA